MGAVEKIRSVERAFFTAKYLLVEAVRLEEDEAPELRLLRFIFSLTLVGDVGGRGSVERRFGDHTP